jgi:hypothetical protein
MKKAGNHKLREQCTTWTIENHAADYGGIPEIARIGDDVERAEILLSAK